MKATQHISLYLKIKTPSEPQNFIHIKSPRSHKNEKEKRGGKSKGRDEPDHTIQPTCEESPKSLSLPFTSVQTLLLSLPSCSLHRSHPRAALSSSPLAHLSPSSTHTPNLHPLTSSRTPRLRPWDSSNKSIATSSWLRHCTSSCEGSSQKNNHHEIRSCSNHELVRAGRIGVQRGLLRIR